MNNKMILLGFVLLLTACSPSKKTSSSSTTTPIYVPKSEKDQGKVSEQESPKDETDKKVEDRKSEKDSDDVKSTPTQEKSSYNIAVLMPLMTNKVPLNYTPFQIDTDINITPEMQESLDFYMGLKLAVDDFKNKGKKINVFVLDDANSDYQTKKILSERPFPDVDVIVHANNQMVSKELVDYSTKTQTPIYSTNTQKSISSELYHTVIPHPNHQLEQLIVKMNNSYPEATIYIIPDESESIHSTNANSFLNFINDQLNVKAKVLKAPIASTNENEPLPAFIENTSTSIVVVLSNRETFVKNIVHRISTHPHPTYILGYATWSNFKNLENESQPQPQIYIPTFQGALVSKSQIEAYNNRFVEEYQMTDNAQSYMGYDLMRYIMTVTDNGLLNEKPTTKYLGISPYQYNFEFLPVYNSKGISYFTNSQVGFLQYNKGKFIPLK